MMNDQKRKIISLLNDYVEDLQTRIAELDQNGYSCNYVSEALEISAKKFLLEKFLKLIDEVFAIKVKD